MAVSPQHRLLISGARPAVLFGKREVLASAKSLVDETTLLRGPSDSGVTYHHLMFDRHQLLWSDNMISESYLPGAFSISTMEEDTRAELLAFFPTLRIGAETYGPAVRPVLKTGEARLLA